MPAASANTFLDVDTATGDIISVGGARRVRLASAADNTRPPNGFVATGVNNAENASVQTGGIVDMATTGFVAGDEGRTVFLSATTSGAGTKMPPSGNGQVVWALGQVIEVGASTLRVQFTPKKVAVL